MYSGAEPRSQRPSTTTRVKVVVRVRPEITEDKLVCQGEETQQDTCTRIDPDGKTIRIIRPFLEPRVFRFDHILGPEVDQMHAFGTCAKAVCEDVLKGYNGACLCYGQTGTGKTHTMFGDTPNNIAPTVHEANVLRTRDNNVSRSNGDSANPPRPNGHCYALSSGAGIVPRAVFKLFNDMKKKANQGIDVQITFSFLQVYMETVSDLLDLGCENMQIREDPRHGIYVEGLTQALATSPKDVLEAIKFGVTHRMTQSTRQNFTSSRSHAILQFNIEQTYPQGEHGESRENVGAACHGSLRVVRSTLTLVDLAGSEKLIKSGSDGLRLEEAKKINKSISALGNCVSALSEGSQRGHVPFRDSKLTRLLTDAIGGNSRAFLCANVGPCIKDCEETFSTLLFASRAMRVKNFAVVNETVQQTRKNNTPPSHYDWMNSANLKGLAGSPAEWPVKQYEDDVTRLASKNQSLEAEILRLKNQLMQAPPYEEASSPPEANNNNNNDNNNNNKPADEIDVNIRKIILHYTSIIRDLESQLAHKSTVISSMERQIACNKVAIYKAHIALQKVYNPEGFRPSLARSIELPSSYKPSDEFGAASDGTSAFSPSNQRH